MDPDEVCGLRCVDSPAVVHWGHLVSTWFPHPQEVTTDVRDPRRSTQLAVHPD